MRKQSLALLTLLLIANLTFGQHQKGPSVLKVDSTWIKENFKLPTRFAQDMTLKGFEEAVFPKGWAKKESPQFWSYLFVWSVETDTIIDSTTMEQNLEIYFNGLMGVSLGSKEDDKLPTTALLVTGQKTSNSIVYHGKIRTFDNFRSKKMMTLYVSATQHICQSNGRALLVFRFSPSGRQEDIWNVLHNITLQENACEIHE